MTTERQWKPIRTYQDILFDFYEGIARITINRPRYRNAFTPLTAQEISNALLVCRETPEIRVVVLTGAGDKAFCSGGDMHVKGRGGYVGGDGVPRLNILDVQKQIRSLPKPVIAMVNGYAIGGGHVLHCFRKRNFRTNRSPCRKFRCRIRILLPGTYRRTEESPRNLVPLSAVFRTGSS